ncbi:chalcone-flavanone isomerase-domain-containing protein [Gongronella butleri]|nr:chalcone-flavanone isomerase-domain-containing protein [Gongronella butleri]
MHRFIRPSLLQQTRSVTTRAFAQQARPARRPLLYWATGLAAAGTLAAATYPSTAHMDAPKTAYAGTVEDPETHLRFPVYLQANQEWQRLIGLGVRQVSFLNLNVYVVGLYMKSEDIGQLLKHPSWKHFSKDQFLSDEALAVSLLQQPVDVSVRIVPVRNTNTQHLRDGFTRSLVSRMKDQAKDLTEEDETMILEGIREFKTKFFNAKVKKDSEFVFTKTKEGSLRMEYEGKEIGVVNNKWVAINFIMTYLNPYAPASSLALESMANGFDKLKQGNATN